MHKMESLRADLEERLSVISRRVSAIQRDRRQVDGPLDADWAEQAIALENSEVLDQLDVSGRKEVEQIANALERLNSGSYGKCQTCEGKINVRRLKALPFTTLCIECAS